MMEPGSTDVGRAAQRVLRMEGLALTNAAHDNHLLSMVVRAVAMILTRNDGKVVTTGMGKSGLVARRIASMFRSIGKAAVYLHPVDALHGDLGILSPRDVLLLVSHSGSTPELLALLGHLRENRMVYPLIGILGKQDSELVPLMDLALVSWVDCDPLEMLPTSSSAVATAIGDALAYGLMAACHVHPKDIRRMHPANGEDQE